MSLVTLYALFADDIRLWAFNKSSDPYFFSFMICALILFAIEIIINSIVVDDYKYSFFFWLDIIATISLIPDIDWLINPLTDLYEFSPAI